MKKVAAVLIVYGAFLIGNVYALEKTDWAKVQSFDRASQ